MTRFIDDHVVRFGLIPICRVPGRNVSTYYADKARPLSERAPRDEHLKPEIRRIFPANYCVYGHRKVYAQLRREGYTTPAAFEADDYRSLTVPTETVETQTPECL